MKRSHKIVIGTTIALSAIVAGTAIGATKLTPKEENQAVLNDAAKQLGVEPNKLSEALKQALKNRVDAAVEDGRLTKEQAARMKERIDSDEAPLFGLGHRGLRHHRDHGPGRHGPGPFFGGNFDGATAYLGMERKAIIGALADGKTLAQLARDRNKSVDGLVDSMLKAAEKRLDGAVAAGKLTEAEKKEMLGGLEERITDLVNHRLPVRRFDREDHGAYFIPSVF